MGDQETFRLSVDRARCEGHGMCEQVAPELIHLNDNAEPVFELDDIPWTQRQMAEAAVQSCPVAALTIYQTGKTETQRLRDPRQSSGSGNTTPLAHGRFL
jgi:ferredoxin